MSLAWGGHINGHIDTGVLVDVSGRGDYLEPAGAAKWLQLVAACKAATGITLAPASGSSAYRPEAIQEEFFTERYVRVSYNSGLWWSGSYWVKKPGQATAAIPGTSNHGWGRAIDLTGYEGRPVVWAWLLAHAAEFGYDWATGRASGEQWHWESLTPPSTVSGGDPVPIHAPVTPQRKKRPMEYGLLKSDSSATIYAVRLKDSATKALSYAEYLAFISAGAILQKLPQTDLEKLVNRNIKW